LRIGRSPTIEPSTPQPTTANEFLDLLRRSQLVKEDQLTKFLGWTEDADTLTAKMVQAGLLTEWQSQKLLERKFKGFFLNYYKLLDHLGRTSASRAYLAQHTVTKRKVRMDVFPPRLDNRGQYRFTVTDY
jgi:serine/threonine-protein kinase